MTGNEKAHKQIFFIMYWIRITNTNIQNIDTRWIERC